MTHVIEPLLTYEDVLGKLLHANKDGIEARFDMGRLVTIALGMGVVIQQIAHDTGVNKGTLSRYAAAWDYWGEERMLGKVAWIDYTQHLYWKDAHDWLEQVDYKRKLLAGGKDKAREMHDSWAKHVIANKPELSGADLRAWYVHNATRRLWDAVGALERVSFATLTAQERVTLANNFRMVINMAERFKAADNA